MLTFVKLLNVLFFVSLVGFYLFFSLTQHLSPNAAKILSPKIITVKRNPTVPDIFFVESSGKDQLSMRQACAIESACFHNPNSIVALKHLSPQLNDSNMFLRQLYKYPNFKKLELNFAQRIRGTSMENWFNHRNWKIMDDNNITDISDAIRWLELWHDGGLYLDLDTITLKQTDHLRNVAGIQNEYSKIGGGINGAVLQFSKPHHELLKPILDTYIHDRGGNTQEWG